MKRILLCGDPHIVPTEIKDCDALLQLVYSTAAEQRVDEICFMGDQNHHFSILHVEVLGFWRDWLKKLGTLARLDGPSGKIKLLLGNHDMPGTESKYHTLMAYEDLCEVVTKPTVDSNILYAPYMDNPLELVQAAQQNCDCPTLICHQTFQGSRYENGFYAPDGVSPDLFPQRLILVGHIHTPQAFGKVTYVGAPRWRTESDANVNRNLWVVSFEDDGSMTRFETFSTNSVCRRILRYTDTEANPFGTTANYGDLVKDDIRIDISGTRAYCMARAAELTAQFPGIKVHTARTDTLKIVVKESEGIDRAFWKFFGNYQPRGSTDKIRLETMVKDRLLR